MFYLCAVSSHLPDAFLRNPDRPSRATFMNRNDHITLQVHYLTRGTQLAHAHILMLKHTDSELHLPVLITEDETEALKKAVEKGVSEEVGLALKMLKSLNANIESIHIVPDLPGRYHAVVTMQTAMPSQHTMTCSVVKGVCLSMTTGCPLLMSKDDFMQFQGQVKDNGQVAFPLPAMTDGLLNEALQVAVDEENYELAATLHKEIQTRKQSGKSKPKT